MQVVLALSVVDIQDDGALPGADEVLDLVEHQHFVIEGVVPAVVAVAVKLAGMSTEVAAQQIFERGPDALQ